jgi:hypothetical protein
MAFCCATDILKIVILVGRIAEYHSALISMLFRDCHSVECCSMPQQFFNHLSADCHFAGTETSFC